MCLTRELEGIPDQRDLFQTEEYKHQQSDDGLLFTRQATCLCQNSNACYFRTCNSFALEIRAAFFQG